MRVRNKDEYVHEYEYVCEYLHDCENDYGPPQQGTRHISCCYMCGGEYEYIPSALECGYDLEGAVYSKALCVGVANLHRRTFWIQRGSATKREALEYSHQ